MTVKTLFAIILKLIGLWILVNCFANLLQVVLEAFAFATTRDSNNNTANVANLSIAIVLYYFSQFAIIYLFLVKTNWLITTLRLTENFESDTIHISLNAITILQIALIIMGSWLFVTSITEFCNQVYSNYQYKPIVNSFANNFILITNFIKAVAAVVLITNSKWVANILHNKNDLSS